MTGVTGALIEHMDSCHPDRCRAVKGEWPAHEICGSPAKFEAVASREFAPGEKIRLCGVHARVRPYKQTAMRIGEER